MPDEQLFKQLIKKSEHNKDIIENYTEIYIHMLPLPPLCHPTVSQKFTATFWKVILGDFEFWYT